jgi:hypothetical protein
MSSAKLCLVAAVLASAGASGPLHASRVEGAAPPAAPSVLVAPQQPAKAQADDSASLRQGLVTATDARATRLQVQGIWLDVAAGQTQVLRGGRPTSIESVRVGDTVSFTLTAGSPQRPTLRVVYAP